MNPNAPLFIPAAVRQVEDFSPEWWQLVTTSTWFHDYWVSQHQGEDGFYGHNEDDFDSTDIIDLLPDTIDLGTDDELSSMEAQFEEFIHLAEVEEGNKSSPYAMKGYSQNGYEMDALMKRLTLSKSMNERGPKSAVETAKYWDKPAKSVSQKNSSRRIQQPR